MSDWTRIATTGRFVKVSRGAGLAPWIQMVQRSRNRACQMWSICRRSRCAGGEPATVDPVIRSGSEAGLATSCPFSASLMSPRSSDRSSLPLLAGGNEGKLHAVKTSWKSTDDGRCFSGDRRDRLQAAGALEFDRLCW